MSSSVVTESSDSHKTENTVIIFVNNDGSISVDEQTLQKLLVSNQSNAPISVVRVGNSQVEEATPNSQTSASENVVETDDAATTQPQVNLTVEGFFSPSTSVPSILSDASNCATLPADPVVVGTDSLVDPFLEMDPEQLLRLETALQSEQAKQILGEGVTAMLDMLTSEDDQTMLKDSIRMDHCYTSCVSGPFPAEAGPSGSKLEGSSHSTGQNQEEEDDDSELGSEDEEATESEEIDSEEEARYKRSARGRGRGRNANRTRGSQVSVMRNKAKARSLKTGISGVTPLRTTPIRSTLAQNHDQLQQQQLKATPVVQLSAPTPVSKQQMPSPSQSVLRSTQQPQQVKCVLVEKDQTVIKSETPKTEEKKQNVRGKVRSVSQSDQLSPQSQPINKGRRKPAIISHSQQKATPRRATTDSVLPKEEPKTPVKGSSVVEESTVKKLNETPVPALPTAQTGTDAGSPRKMYPKRENRKPPAHLVEAFGPALFSAPDIPKRISDGKPGDLKSEKAEPSSPEVKLETPKIEETDISESKEDLMDPFADVAKELLEEGAQSDTKEILAAELQSVLGDIGQELLAQEQIEDSIAYESNDTLQITLPDTNKAKGSAIEKRRRSSSSKLSASAIKELVSKDSDEEGASSSKTVQSQAGNKRRSGGVSKITAAAIRDLQAPSDEEQVEEEEEEGDEDWDSEDDPDRLWCICRKPHNNRFMICCDRCEEWFHGNCVGITKALGKQMESRGEEWSCPPCTKLKQQEQQMEKAKLAESKRQQTTPKGAAAPASGGKRRNSTAGTATASAVSPRRKSVSDDKGKSPASTPTQQKGVMCIVCKKAIARSASIYCSDSCILKHAEESVNLLSKEKTPSTQTAATVADKVAEGKVASQAAAAAGTEKSTNLQSSRVFMVDRLTGKLVSGNNASSILNLKNWLQEHPTFEVVHPSMLSTLKNQKVLKTFIVQQLNSGKPASKVATGPLLKSDLKPVVKSTPTTPTTPKTALLVPALKMTPTIKPATQTGKTATTSAVAATPGKATTVAKVQKTPVTKATTGSKPVVVTKATAVRSNSTVEKQASGSNTSNQATVSKPHVPAAEPIRINVRKTLKDLLQSRVQECDDIKVNENEVTGIATSIEEELFSFFKDTGAKYKSKYRSLIFNIKDPKNLALFRKIVSGEVSPHRLVRLSPEELATKELAQWREREAQHTLDMIKKNELELMSQSITYLMKTHKGEQVIETDDSLKLQASAVEAESTGLEATSVSSTVEDMSLEKFTDKPSESLLDSKSSSSKKKDHSHSHHRERDKDKGSSRHHDNKKHSRHDKHHSSSSSSSSRSKSRKSSKSKDSKSSTTRSSKDKNSSSSSKHHSHHRRTSESHSSKSRHHSDPSDAGETEKTSRSSSSLSKNSEIKTKDSKSSSNDKPFKSPTSTTSLTAPITPESAEAPVIEQNSKDVAEDIKPVDIKHTVQEIEVSTNEAPPVVSTDDAELSDREPSSTVNIKTPDSITEDSAPPYLYRGLIFMPEVAKFIIAAYEVSGTAAGLRHELPETLEVVGRISPDTVWEYISKMKKTGTKEIVVIRLNPAGIEEKKAWASFYTYLSSRNRFGVVGSKGSTVKDFYIMPLSSHSPVPQVLLPLDGPGFEEARPHLLLGIIVRGRRKRIADTAGLSNVPARSTKEARVVGSERSYTPPLPEPRDSGSFTPPLPAVAPQKPSSPVSDDKDDMPYSPGGSPEDEYLPTATTDEVTGVFSNELEELNRKIEEQKQQIENISSELVCTNSQGASGSGDTVQVSSLLQQISTQATLLSTGVPGISQLVVKTDITEVSQSTKIRSNSVDDENEAYSPSRSLTPPPPEDVNMSAFKLPDTSNISLPSNLQEILASIQRKSGSNDPITTTGVLSLETDPIVREYASADEPPSTPPPETENKAEETFPDSDSLDPPTVPPPPPPSSVTQNDRPRDPRRAPEPAQKSLSKLTEAELIAKANEMMLEMAGASQPVPSNQESRSNLTAPLPPTGQIFYPPPPMPPLPIPPMMLSKLTAPPATPPLPIQLPVETRSTEPAPQPLPPGVSIGEWQATATEEAPRKGISFRVEKRRLQPRWSKSNSSGSRSEKKSSPKSLSPSSSPPSRRRKDSSD